MVTVNIERAQRGTDKFEAGYNLAHELREGENIADVIRAEEVSFDYVNEVRERQGFSVLMDYELPHGKLMFSNFISQLDRHEKIRTDQYNTDSNNHSRRFRERKRQLDILTNSISGEHEPGFGQIDWRLSRTASLTRHPFDSRFRFRENSGFDASQLVGARSPEQIISAAYNNLDNSFLYRGDFFTEKSEETDYNAQINVKMPYMFNKQIAGYLKFGGKYINKRKERDRGHSMSRLDVHQGPEFVFHHTRYGDPDFEYDWTLAGDARIYNYVDPNFNVGPSFLGGGVQ